MYTHTTWKHGRRIENEDAVLDIVTQEKGVAVTCSADMKVSK